MSAHGFERSAVHTAGSSEAAFENIAQAHERIEADDIGRVGHEIGQRVDVVEVQTSVALTLQELDTTEVEPRGCADAQHGILDPSRWIDRLDFAAGFGGRLDRAQIERLVRVRSD